MNTLIKYTTSTFAALALATSVFAAPELTEENVATLTSLLEGQGFTVEDVQVDGDNYSVLAANEDGAQVQLTVNETYEVLDSQPAAE